MTKESCAELLKTQRYNPEILPQLEAYVEAQCKGNTHDIECNLAVLKLCRRGCIRLAPKDVGLAASGRGSAL